MESELTIEMPNRPEEIRRVRRELDEFGRSRGVAEPVRLALDLCLEEWLTNVLKYAFVDGREHAIRLRLRFSGQEARLEIEDDGRPFNPLDQPPPDTTAPLEERQLGGLGIFMIRKTMDTVEYQRRTGRNVLTLTKRT